MNAPNIHLSSGTDQRDDQQVRGELSEYVRTLRARQNDEAVRHGITTWAMMVAAIYVLWHLAPQLVEVSKVESARSVFYQSFTHILLGLLSALMLLTPHSRGFRKRQLDYRINNNDPIDLITWSIRILTLFLAAPLYITVWIRNNLEISDPIISAQTEINFYTLSILSVSFVSACISTLRSIKNEKYPAAYTVATDENSRSAKIVNVIGLVISTELFIGNTIAAFKPLLSQQPGALSAFLCGLDVAVLLVLASRVMDSSSKRRNLNFLAGLERDIVIHGISNDEIKDRLESDLLGRSLGGWISDQISALKEKEQELLSTFDSMNDSIREILEIPKTMKHEISGRKAELLDRIDKLVDEYGEISTPLIKWLKSAQTRAGHIQDIETRKLIRRTLHETEESVKLTIQSAKTRLKQADEQLKNHASD